MEEIVESIRDGFAPGDFAEVARNIPVKGTKSNKHVYWALAFIGVAAISLIAWHYYEKSKEDNRSLIK